MTQRGFAFLPILLVIVALILAGVLSFGLYLLSGAGNDNGINTNIGTTTVVKNFDECAAAGYPVGESYPRQCFANRQTFVEDIANTNNNATTGPAVCGDGVCAVGEAECIPSECGEGWCTDDCSVPLCPEDCTNEVRFSLPLETAEEVQAFLETKNNPVDCLNTQFSADWNEAGYWDVTCHSNEMSMSVAVEPDGDYHDAPRFLGTN
ncbi:MAG: hypothetical protein WCV86_02400 [Patescibacteria group bacterium]|jgi:hypothetical protein